jgi:hypothetical protein
MPGGERKNYNEGMARGWESKSVEAQIEESKSTPSNQHPQQSISQEELHRKSQRANLQLSRQRILHQLESSTSDRYSEMLRRSLAELDGQLGSGS